VFDADFVFLEPTFRISDAPESSHFSDLLDIYIEKAHAAFDVVISSFLHSSPSASSSSTPSSHSSYTGLLDIFDLTPSESGAFFKEEMSSLVESVERIQRAESEDTFTALQVTGLAKIAKEHGRESAIYIAAAKSLEAVLSSVSQKSHKSERSLVSLIGFGGGSNNRRTSSQAALLWWCTHPHPHRNSTDPENVAVPRMASSPYFPLHNASLLSMHVQMELARAQSMASVLE
jgi:hypothetical protein